MNNQPDYVLKIKQKQTTATRKAGVGWKNIDGSITIRLDLCTTLTDDTDILITLFPKEKQSDVA